MDKTEILNELKSTKGNFKLPKNMDFSIEDDVLHIYVSSIGLTSNMQTDDAAFEGWAICLKAWFPTIKKVIIDSKDKVFPIGNVHYNRFLYRLVKFIETYSWAETCDFAEEIVKFKAYKLVVNAPKREAMKSAEHGEAQLERNYCFSEEAKYDVIDHQLPVHLFNNEVKKEKSITPNSFLDIWSIKGNELNIFELKLPTNKKVGIISELMFYVNVMSDIMKHNIAIPSDSKYRSFNRLFKMYQDKTCTRVNGIFLTDELHPMIELKKCEILTIINEGDFIIDTRYNHKNIEI